MVHTWCAEYAPLIFTWSLLMGAFLYLTNGNSQVPCASATCHGLHCLGTDLTGHREKRNDRHTFRKAGIERATHCDRDTPTTETRERGHWGYWHDHAHINDTFAQDFTHSHSYQIKVFKALWHWQSGKIYHSLPYLCNCQRVSPITSLDFCS